MLGNGIDVTVGAPLVAGACVGAAVLAQSQSDKVLVFKKNRRHNYRRKNGHRQDLTVLRITEILTDGQKPSKAAVEAKPAEAAPKKAKPKRATIKRTVTEGGAKPKAAAAKTAKPKAAKAKKE
jgi:large subunit ribosomal protein L21